jgi:YD repeat-containing protein
VQFETWRAERWTPVVRYDSAHGQPHRDTLDEDGRVVEKHWLSATMKLNAAMQYAIRDLKANWRTYLAAFEEEQG